MAATTTAASVLAQAPTALGQQNPADPTVTLLSSGTYFASGTGWSNSSDGSRAAGQTPAPGYAYVVTGNAAGTAGLLQTYTATAPTFAGDSLTILPFNAQANLYNTSTTIANALDTSAALEINGPSTGQAVTINNLILGNGGAVLSNASGPAVLNGQIDLLGVGTVLDGFNTSASGGILDVNNSSGLTVNSTLVGTGQLRLVSSVRGSQSNSTITLNGSAGTLAGGASNFSGGVVIDSTVNRSTAGGRIIVDINSATTLGSGPLTVQSVTPGGVQTSNTPTFDNTTGSTLSLANAMQWNGNFSFTGTNSIYTTGTATLGNNTVATVTANVLAVANVATGGHTLNVSSSTPAGGALEVPGLSNISGGGTLTVGIGGTLAFPAATNTPAALAGYATTLVNNGSFVSDQYGETGLIGIETANVSGGTYNMTSSLPAGLYGLNKLGAGTLRLMASNANTGPVVISGGTVQLGVANALDNSEYVAFGGQYTPSGSLDLNGFSPANLVPIFGGNGGVLTNSNASSTSTFTIQPATGTYSQYLPSTSFGGQITGNIAVVVNYPAPASNAANEPSFNNTTANPNTYTGGTTLVSGVLSVGSSAGLPLDGKTVFAGGALLLTAQYGGEDLSAAFSSAPNQQYYIGIEQGSAVDVFASGLNSKGGSLTVGILNTDGSAHSGYGTLVLAGSNGYTGPTTVNFGTLQIANPKGLAGTSGVTVPSYTPIATGSLPQAGTLSINDSSGSVGLVNGQPITAYISGSGNNFTYVRAFIPPNPIFQAVGYTQYGALQGATNVNAVWAGNVVIGSAGDAGAGISGGYNGSAGGSLTVTGAITGTGPLTVGLNPGTTTVLANGNDAYTGETQINCSTGAATALQLGANNAIPATSGLNFTFNNAYTTGRNTTGFNASVGLGTQTFDLNRYGTSVAYLTNSNYYKYTNYGPYAPGGKYSETTGSTVPAVITNTAAAGTTSTLTIAGDTTGTFTLAGSNTTTFPTFSGAITDGPAGGKVVVVMNAPGYVQVLSGTGSNYSGGTTVDAGTLVLTQLAAAGRGNLTVNGGAVVAQNTSLGTVTALAASGFAGGRWTGAGVNSTAAANDPAHLTAVGLYQPPAGQTVSFDGQPVTSADVAIAYTYYGDTNLDGVVNAADYTRVDAGFVNGLTGWQNGDFNYDGVVDGTDYALMDNAFNQQTAALTPAIAVAADAVATPAAAVAAVPEPTSAAAAVGLLAGGLARRRRRRR